MNETPSVDKIRLSNSYSYSVEYSLQLVALLATAGALVELLVLTIHETDSVDLIGFPLAVLLVTAPTALLLSLRLKRLERSRPALRRSLSKHRCAQVAQVITFAACLIALVAFVYNLFLYVAGESTVSVEKSLLDVLGTVLVSGGVFAYYWRDDHVTGE